MSNWFSDDYNDVNFKCDKKYVIDNYPISQREQEKVFNDFKEKPWVLYIKDNNIYNNDNKIKNFLSSNIFKYNDDKIATIINNPQFDNGILIFNQKTVKEISGSKTHIFSLPSGGHIIKHIVQQSGLTKSEKYCSRDNFVPHQCEYTNNYGSCDFIGSSFAVEKNGIYDVNDEEKQKLQQGAEIKLCGQKFPARSHYNLESCVDKRRKEKEQKLLSLFNKKIKTQNENTKKYFERWQNNTRKMSDDEMSDDEICGIDCGYLKCNGQWCGCI